MNSTYQHLVDVLTDKFEVSAAATSPRTTLAELELDSLAVVEFFVTLQDHYGVELDNDFARSDTCLADLASLVRAELDGASRREQP